MRISCEVDIDVDDILCDLDDAQLAEHGLMSVDKAPPATTGWHAVQQALRSRDQCRLHDLLSDMAWKQAGVILPIGMPLPN